MQRGFYSLEATRRVFYIQCAVALTNVVAAHLLVAARPPVDTAPMLVVANLLSYLVGSVISFTVLRRTLGELQGAAAGAVRRTHGAGARSRGRAAAWGVEWALSGLGEEPHPLVALAPGWRGRGLAAASWCSAGPRCCGSARSPAWSTPSRRGCAGAESP